jgi:hypothetical protein
MLKRHGDVPDDGIVNYDIDIRYSSLACYSVPCLSVYVTRDPLLS